MPLQLDDLAALDEPVRAQGVPLMLPVDSIDEDPEQPRQEFDSETLEELAQTIRERGVRQPISVRKAPEPSERWVLNFGARRLRAARLAGATEVPAFVDSTADTYDQVIENEQREGLRPLEIALFVQKRLAAGESQAEIARRLGKSRQYVTYATALVDAPAWLLQLYREGRCQGIAELYELRKLHGQHAREVEEWCTTPDLITRSSLGNLKARLPLRRYAAETGSLPDELPAGGQLAASSSTQGAQVTKGPDERSRPGKPVLVVEVAGMQGRLVVSAAPDLPGHVFVQPESGGSRRLVRACDVKILGFAGRRA
jgi:ParB family chromosome partitioning protein